MKQLNKKIISRLAVIQFLYQKFFFSLLYKEHKIFSIKETMKEASNFIHEHYSEPEIFSDHFHEYPNIKIIPNIKYYKELILLIVEKLPFIDQIIYSKCNKKSDKIDILILSILRPAICELKYIGKLSFKIVINEYTTLANELLDHYQIGFINFVLDSYAKIEEKTI
ncbi:MAG: hypothetical protein ISN64_00735 [Rickettsia sp.]|nr:hypothetical protein [Rickettsia sp.]